MLSKTKKYVFYTVILYMVFQQPTFGKTDVQAFLNPMTGNEFSSKCAVRDQPDGALLHIGVCLGYTMGLSDGLSLLQLGKPDRWTPICIPEGVNIGQKRDVILDYIAKNPANRHEMISMLAIMAWRSAWPCSENN
ncbi:MAG: Rap1a/Tai family immunity protein [Prosthecobacter sp.]|jgi:hypothetical protein|nr:Rap1a/Tai family immunity protein [Prosthecobacter sp.]